MTQAELRQAKGNLHYVIVDEILSYSGTWQEDAELWLYVIELASTELQKKLCRSSQKPIDKRIKVWYNKYRN